MFFFSRFFLFVVIDSRIVKGKAGPDKARSPRIGEAWLLELGVKVSFVCFAFLGHSCVIYGCTLPPVILETLKHFCHLGDFEALLTFKPLTLLY